MTRERWGKEPEKCQTELVLQTGWERRSGKQKAKGLGGGGATAGEELPYQVVKTNKQQPNTPARLGVAAFVASPQRGCEFKVSLVSTAPGQAEQKESLSKKKQNL